MMLSGKLHTESDPVLFGSDAKYVCAILDYDTKILMVFTSGSTETHILGNRRSASIFKWSKTIFHYGEEPIVQAMERIRELYEQDGGPIPDGVRALEL